MPPAQSAVMSSPQHPASRVIAISGAASGIGEACGVLFAARGDTVFLLDRDADAGSRLASRLGAASMFLQVDVANRDSVRAAFGRIADRAVQMHGAAGIAMDLPISRIYQDARAARIYDGASEVHRMVIARDMLTLALEGGSVRGACGAL